jgi:glyoxylate carboligase
MRLKGAQILIEELVKQGVDTVFGYPGGAVLDIYDELYKNSDRINHIISAHEQGACHAADGYARASGKTGVVIATSGPGATNLVTGIANANLDSVPLVAITGNVSVNALGRDSFQEVDIVGITQPVVKHNFMVRSVQELEQTIKEQGVLTSKEYVRGSKNLYTHPAVSDYNRTTDSANKTVSTLMRIIKSFGVEDNSEEQDPLLEIINGDSE